MLDESAIALAFPSRYLKAADLRGKEVTLHVHDINRDDLQLGGGGKKSALVVDLVEMQKRPEAERKQLVLNKTNAMRIAWHHGSEMNAWVGKPFKLHASTTQMRVGGETRTVDCIRVVQDAKLQTDEGRAYARKVLPQQWKRWWR
jgi:hypothetical protein